MKLYEKDVQKNKLYVRAFTLHLKLQRESWSGKNLTQVLVILELLISKLK